MSSYAANPDAPEGDVDGDWSDDMPADSLPVVLRNSLLHNPSDIVPGLASINEDIYFAKGNPFLEIQLFRSEFIKIGR